jgi:hypothetical protein
MGTVFYLFISI